MVGTQDLLGQLEFYWENSLAPRLQGLTDAEYFWEPVSGCWSIRDHDGQTRIDWAWPAPEPAPVTTIAWRMAHISIATLGVRASSHFGDGSLTLETATWPDSAVAGIATLQQHYEAWRAGVSTLTDKDLSRPVGTAEPGWEDYSMATLVLHISREVIHHGAEIALMRDLYRAQ